MQILKVKLWSHRAPGLPRSVPDPILGYPWLDPSRVRSTAVMVLGGPGKVRGGPGQSGKVREVVFEILNCLKNLGGSVMVWDDP